MHFYQACVPIHITLYFLTRTIVTLFLEFFTVPFYNIFRMLGRQSFTPHTLSLLYLTFFLNTLTLKYFMYLIDHVAELRCVNRLIYAIKRIYTHRGLI